MNNIILNSSVSWKLLPWIKISQKIFILQQKVYKFSRRCNQHKVYQFQDYMINSSDVKLFIIQKTINNINKYYNNYNKKKYKVKDKIKFYIYKNLYNIQKYKKSIKIILEYIKQYLIYVCIKPEWEARFEPIYKLDSNTFNKSFYIYQISDFFSSNSRNILKTYTSFLSINKSTKYLVVSYFIKRIQSLPYIKYYISCWLNYRNMQYSLYLRNTYDVSYPSVFNCLEILVNYIMLNGWQWYLIYTLNFSKKNNSL
uniref:Reverse transcriptase N-terminal domain-containing protein n=1 Tax=Hypnea pannosa TaxID=105607 RepID=A0A4D6WVI9_9FLOR|nr:hypothetical protein [Hypnea pannosa]